MSLKNDTPVEQLLTHANRYGADGVMEAAVESRIELNLELQDLIALRDRLDWLEANPTGKYATPKTHRLSAENRVKRLLGISEKGE